MLLASPLKREFTYQGLKLADPNPKLTVEKVRSFYLAQYPDLATAAPPGRRPRARNCVTASCEPIND
jgi:PRTRC genetic system protein C